MKVILDLREVSTVRNNNKLQIYFTRSILEVIKIINNKIPNFSERLPLIHQLSEIQVQ